LFEQGGAFELLKQLGGPPNLVLVADCVFAPLYGASDPLLEVLRQLIPPDSLSTSVLISAERRPR
jgi:hypothetical protein